MRGYVGAGHYAWHQGIRKRLLPIITLVGLFNRHNVEDIHHISRVNIEEYRIRPGDVHPAVPVFEKFNIGGRSRVLKLVKMLFDQPPIFIGKAVKVA
jgi:hypothetical protein